MKNKKGFTLVELLAVIAILAILMLLIMPNVLNMFQNGRKEAFKVQVGSIIKVAQTQKQSDAFSGKNTTGYCDKISSSQCTSDMKLDVTDSDVKYAVVFNNSGVVTSIAVEDSNYCYVNTTDVTNINPNNFVQGGHLSCSGLTCTCDGTVDQTPEPSYSYVYWTTAQGGSGTSYNSSSKPRTTYDTIAELGLTSPGQYIRTKINSSTNEVQGHEVCLYQNNKVFCLEPNYWETDGETTKNKLKTSMEAALGTTASSCDSLSSFAHCDFGSGYCYARNDGLVYCDDGSGHCYVYAPGIAICY